MTPASKVFCPLDFGALALFLQRFLDFWRLHQLLLLLKRNLYFECTAAVSAASLTFAGETPAIRSSRQSRVNLSENMYV
jgi:hypothetical protein